MIHKTKPAGLEIIKSWANGIAKDDNEMVYLRKKNGIFYVMKVEPNSGRTGKWEKLDCDDEPVITDIHGAKLEEVAGEFVAQKAPVEKELKPIPNIPLGWYQDEKANLYRYNGTAMWEGADMKQWGKLLELADSGMLEFLG
jgi:hypothetical protein